MEKIMNKFAQILLTAVFGLASSSSFAGAPAQWYNSVIINYVYVGQVGNRVAISVAPNPNFGDCPGNQELIIDQTNPHAKAMLALIMTAYTTTKIISVYTNGVCGPTGNGVLLTDLRLP
jgi:hypothetical protein